MNSKKVPEAGILLAHGDANYNFNKGEKESYYIKIGNGEEGIKTVWGIGLPEAIERSGAKIGQQITIENIRKKPVTVEELVRDESGRVISKEFIDTHRNEWEIEVIPAQPAIVSASLAPNQSSNTHNENSLTTEKVSREQTNDFVEKGNSIARVDRKTMETPLQNQEPASHEKIGTDHQQSTQNDASQHNQPGQSESLSKEVVDAKKKATKVNYSKDGYGLPETIKSAYIIFSGKFYDKKTDVLQFEDHGKKLSTLLEDRQIVADMVSVASVKNWDILELKGTEQFRRTAWVEAALRNIDTIGYDPTKQDLDQLKKLMQEQGRSCNEIAAAMEKCPTEPEKNELAFAGRSSTRSEQLNNDVAFKMLEKVLGEKKVSERQCREILTAMSALIDKGGVKLPEPKIVGLFEPNIPVPSTPDYTVATKDIEMVR